MTSTAVTVVSLAVLAVACGSAGPVSVPDVERTRTETMRLFADGAEPAAGVTVTNEVSADCSASLLSPENPLSRRCFTNETSLVMDPCFVPDEPVTGLTHPEYGPDLLPRIDTVALCVSDPWEKEVTRAYVLTDSGAAPPVEEHFDPHWFLELADGTRCEKVFGVEELREGQHLSYDCDDGYLYGIPDEDKPVWTIHHADGESGRLEVAEVRTAWN